MHLCLTCTIATLKLIKLVTFSSLSLSTGESWGEAFLRTLYVCAKVEIFSPLSLRLRVIEKLKDRWKNLTFTEVEDEDVIVNEQWLDEEIQKGKLSLVGRLFVERSVNKEVLRSTMAKVWKTSKPFSVKEIKPNLYVISFESQGDKTEDSQRKTMAFQLISSYA